MKLNAIFKNKFGSFIFYFYICAMKKDTRLQELTDKFINEFFSLAHKVNVSERKESFNTTKAKRSDSYEFNYTLADCIANSAHVQKHQIDSFMPLLGMGFAQNIVKNLFNENIQGTIKRVLFAVKNHAKQDTYLDYFIRNVKTVECIVDDTKTNPKYWSDKTQPMFIPTKVKKITHTFTLHNTKSGYEGVCMVVIKNRIFVDVTVYNTKHDLLFTIRQRLVDDFDPKGKLKFKDVGEIHHFKHVADINSFFLVLDQSIVGIKNTIHKEKQK